MLFSDSYFEIDSTKRMSLRERGSKFIACCFPVKNELEIKNHLQQLRSEFPDATHHCYAWILNPDQSAQRSTDDGEPSNSAGKPILRAILSNGLTNVLVVVVRYFGGTQLGIPGLIQAYGDAANLVLKECNKIEKYIEMVFSISADFAHEQEIHRMINKYECKVISNEYKEQVTYTVGVRKSVADEFEKKVRENYLLNLVK